MPVHQPSRPEPMNASPHHPKVKVSLTLGSSIHLAGGLVTGKLEMECKTDKGLGIEVMMVELFAVQELTSRDHSATSTFLHTRRLFQGPGLPPSNAVQAHPMPGDQPLPPNYHQARRGISTFLFRFPIPASSPASISFGGGLATLRYEVRASVGASWKGEKRLVTDKKELNVIESFVDDPRRPEPEAVVVGENGKIWAQGRIVNGFVVAGETACVELQVKNHSAKKNSGLLVTLTRSLHLCGVPPSEQSPIQISDTVMSVPFKGPEYIIPPGAEGVASLVFDIPKYARSVKGGVREADLSEGRKTEPLFEVRCIIGIKITMGIGSKDISMEIPVNVVHPYALPELPPPEQYSSPYQEHPHSPYAPQPPVRATSPYGYPERAQSPYAYPALPMSPQPYHDHNNQVWLPPPQSHTPSPYHQFAQVEGQQYYYPQPPIVRPSSAEPIVLQRQLPVVPQQPLQQEMELGKGDKALRTSHHLRLSSRNRSVSPQAHSRNIVVPTSSIPVPPPSNPDSLPRGPPSTSMFRESRIPSDTDSAPLPPVATSGLSVSPVGGGDKLVHSPRPVLSPRQSFSVDPVTHKTLEKNDQVEQLEQMAAVVADVDLSSTKDIAASMGKGTGLALSLAAAASTQSSKKDDSPNINKTLPGMPGFTDKGKGKSKSKSRQPSVSSTTRPRVDTFFPASNSLAIPDTAPDAQPASPSQTPPTPTLTAITPSKTKRPDLLTAGRTESGLDALERRLLMEVGTRKPPSNTKTDVRSVLSGMTMAMPIPSRSPAASSQSPDALKDDSAISSLTLGNDMEAAAAAATREERDRDSDGKTQKARRSMSISGDERAAKEEKRRRSKGTTTTAEGSSEQRKSHRKKKEKEKEKRGEKDGESHRIKSAAKGRVAAWLGGIDPDEKPPVDISPSPTPVTPPETVDVPAVAEKPKVDTPVAVAVATTAKTLAPNPRSSGFVAISTFKRDPTQQRPSVIKKNGKVEAESRKVTDIWKQELSAKPAPFVPRLSPAEPPKTHRRVSPPSEDTSSSSSSKPTKIPNAKLPAFPPPRLLDPEVKYDIRSARGGRGGKVTAVASLWASGAPSSDSNAKTNPADIITPSKPVRSAPPKSPLSGAATVSTAETSIPKYTKPTIATSDRKSFGADFAGKRAVNGSTKPGIIKSTSVPASISSSHATPMLSSTASLARPPPPRKAAKPTTAKVMPPVVEHHNPEIRKLRSTLSTSSSSPDLVSTKTHSSTDSSTSTPPLAFGQARLRDLIKKYQGQAST